MERASNTRVEDEKVIECVCLFRVNDTRVIVETETEYRCGPVDHDESNTSIAIVM